GGEPVLQVQSADEMAFFQVLNGGAHVLGGYRPRPRVKQVNARVGDDDRKRVVMFAILQEVLDDIDLGPGQERVAIGRRLDKAHPGPAARVWPPGRAPDDIAASGSSGFRARTR